MGYLLSEFPNRKRIGKMFDNINIWLVLFIIWGLPLGYYRNEFRKCVYQTDCWTINLKPVFLKEIKGLLCNIYPENPFYIRKRNFYRFYLLVYFSIFTLYLYLN